MDEPHVTHHLVIGVFADANAAASALDALLAARKSQSLDAPAAAIVRKDAAGAVEIKETDALDPTKGAIAGGVVGGILGLFSGKMLAGAGLGALIGGIGANYIDTGVPDDRLKQIGAGLQPDSGAVVAIVADAALAPVRALLERLGATVTAAPIPFEADVAKNLSSGDYGAALSSLATQTGKAVTDTGAWIGDTAKSAGAAAQQATQDAADAAQSATKPAGEPPAATSSKTPSEPPAGAVG